MKVAATSESRRGAGKLLDDFSLEITGKDTADLTSGARWLPVGTRVNVTFLAHETLELRLGAARTVRRLGFEPVPHVAGRRFPSHASLTDYLTRLRHDGNAGSLFVVGGDPRHAEGPFGDALAVITSGAMHEHGVREVGIAGYPEGHPDINDDDLRDALTSKADALERLGIQASVTTQFGFDADHVLDWIAQTRRHGIDVTIRVGVPGPAGIKRLMAYASRFGVRTSSGIVRKYGMSLANLAGSAGPDRFIHQLASGYDVDTHGDVRLHFFTFGGVEATARWIHQFRAAM